VYVREAVFNEVFGSRAEFGERILRDVMIRENESIGRDERA
jgi:hypothetical protein